MPKPVLPPEQAVDLHFPLAGVDTSSAFDRQPNRAAGGPYARTTPVGVNVRGFDQATQRNRGAQRPGLAKYIPATVNGVALIQELNVIVGTGYTSPATATAGFLMYVNYAWDLDGAGATITVRLVMTPVARSVTSTQDGNILGVLPAGQTDFPNDTPGYKLRLTWYDGSDLVTPLQPAEDVPFEMYGGGPWPDDNPTGQPPKKFYGIPPTKFYFKKMYSATPTPPIQYVGIPQLIDKNGNVPTGLDGAGVAANVGITGAGVASPNMQTAFAASTTPGTGPDGETEGQLGDSSGLTTTYTFRYYSVWGFSNTSSGTGPSYGSYPSYLYSSDQGTVLSSTPTNSYAALYSYNASQTGTFTDGYNIGSSILVSGQSFSIVDGEYFFANFLGRVPLYTPPSEFLMKIAYWGGYGPALTATELAVIGTELMNQAIVG